MIASVSEYFTKGLDVIDTTFLVSVVKYSSKAVIDFEKHLFASLFNV